jgi:hypothetical protein
MDLGQQFDTHHVVYAVKLSSFFLIEPLETTEGRLVIVRVYDD